MEAPKYQQAGIDQAFPILQQQQQQQNIQAIQQTIKGDTAGLLARYGANLAFTGGAPGASMVPGIAQSAPSRAA